MESRELPLPAPPLGQHTPEETPPLALEEVEEQWAALSCDSEATSSDP